jgi:hypothetical protein
MNFRTGKINLLTKHFTGLRLVWWSWHSIVFQIWYKRFWYGIEVCLIPEFKLRDRIKFNKTLILKELNNV